MTDEHGLREPTSEELKRAARLLTLLERRGTEGERGYSDEDVLHFLPLVFLSVAPMSATSPPLPEAVVRLLGLFAEKAGIDPDAAPPEVQAAVEGYYAAHPVHPELLAAFQGFVRQELAAAGPSAGAFATFLGDGKRTALPSQERPEGTVPGGPLARLAGVKRDDDER